MKVHEVLKKRALRLLEDAKLDMESGYYDLAAFHLEQALQLYLKSLLYRMGIGERRTHEIRELLADLYMNLKYLGKDGLAKEIMKIAREERNNLSALEEAYYEARYKPSTYTKEEVEELFNVVEKLIELFKKIEGELW